MRVFKETNCDGNNTGRTMVEIEKKELAVIIQSLKFYCCSYSKKQVAKRILDYMEKGR